VRAGCHRNRVKHILQLTKTTVVINYYYRTLLVHKHTRVLTIYDSTMICVSYTALIIGNEWTTPRKHVVTIGKIERFYCKYRFRCIIYYILRAQDIPLSFFPWITYFFPPINIFFFFLHEMGYRYYAVYYYNFRSTITIWYPLILCDQATLFMPILLYCNELRYI